MTEDTLWGTGTTDEATIKRLAREEWRTRVRRALVCAGWCGFITGAIGLNIWLMLRKGW